MRGGGRRKKSRVVDPIRGAGVPVTANYVHGAAPGSVDAAIYGFIANIHFYDIATPLKEFVSARPSLMRHCTAIHERVMRD